MVSISYEINGKKINSNNIRDALEQAMLEGIDKSINEAVVSLRCNEHNQTPKILVKGSSIDNLSIEVSGCCNDIIKKATNKLN